MIFQPVNQSGDRILTWTLAFISLAALALFVAPAAYLLRKGGLWAPAGLAAAPALIIVLGIAVLSHL